MMYVHMDHIDPDIADTGSVCVFVVCVYLTFPKGRHTFSCSIYHLLSINKTIENVYFIVLPKVFLFSYLISGS